jgi:hypothetical protein
MVVLERSAQAKINRRLCRPAVETAIARYGQAAWWAASKALYDLVTAATAGCVTPPGTG